MEAQKNLASTEGTDKFRSLAQRRYDLRQRLASMKVADDRSTFVRQQVEPRRGIQTVVA